MSADITVVCARGIGEQLDVPTTLSLVTNPLPRDRFRIVNVRHRSDYGPIPNPNGQAYNKTRIEAIKLGFAEILRAPGPVVLAGYSGGADSMGDLADQIGRGLLGPLARTKLIAVALIADPKNPRINWAPQWGVAGSRLITGSIPVFRANDPNDMIPFCDGDSPIRTFADYSEGFSLVDVVGWGNHTAMKIRAKQLQQVAINWRDPASVKRQFDRAAVQFSGYRTGDHTSYHRRIEPGTRKMYVANLTEKIASLA